MDSLASKWSNVQVRRVLSTAMGHCNFQGSTCLLQELPKTNLTVHGSLVCFFYLAFLTWAGTQLLIPRRAEESVDQWQHWGRSTSCSEAVWLDQFRPQVKVWLSQLSFHLLLHVSCDLSALGKAGLSQQKQYCGTIAHDGIWFARMVFYYVRAKIPCVFLFKMGAVRAFQCGLHICSKASMSVIVLN